MHLPTGSRRSARRYSLCFRSDARRVGNIPSPSCRASSLVPTWLSCNSAEAAEIAGSGRDRGECRAAARRALPACRRRRDARRRRRAVSSASRRHVASVPGFAVDAVDTNGAGDTHIGAFISALAQGATPFDAARYANAAAAISVTRHGGASAPTRRRNPETFWPAGTS